mgnify:CR=1 FL=1|tara:strand:- start:8574 stop:8768 length:195 start_codon:yes stop_codon:yes gene_type:complete
MTGQATRNSANTIVSTSGITVDSQTSGNNILLIATVAAGLTQGALTQLVAENDTSARIILSADL